jgi:hypothetical protein
MAATIKPPTTVISRATSKSMPAYSPSGGPPSLSMAHALAEIIGGPIDNLVCCGFREISPLAGTA